LADARVVSLTLDTTKPEQLATAARKADDVTLLINNAGVATSYNVLTTSPAELDADFRTNVHGTLGVIRVFLPVLERAREGATIVNVLSLASLASFPVLGGYSASKAAAYSITQALRPELRAKHIDILAVLPGPSTPTWSGRCRCRRPVPPKPRRASSRESPEVTRRSSLTRWRSK
jgi:short-subunit dehydrogenase